MCNVMCSRGLLICLRVPVQCTQSVSFSERGGGGGGGRLFPGMYGFVLVCLSSGTYGLLWVGTVITKQQRIKTEVFRYFEWTSRSSRDLLSLVGVSICEVVFVPGCVRDRMWVLR